MQKISLPVISLLVIVLLSSCLSVFVPVETAAPLQPTIALATNAPPSIQSVVPVTTLTTSAQSAPLCASDPIASACSAPLAEVRDKFCVQKIPYTQIALPVGTTFEPVGPLLICTDEGIRGGMQIITCRSPQINYSYDLKVCNSACSAASGLTVGTGQCSEGYGYSAANACCWPVPTTDAGCALFKVDIGTCQ